jgi:hypothetical protein
MESDKQMHLILPLCGSNEQGKALNEGFHPTESNVSYGGEACLAG